MSDLPEGWTRCTIGSLCDLINGRSFKPSDWTPTGLPIVQIQNLNDPAAPFNRFDGEVRSLHRDQRSSTFLKNHADAIIACDFCVVASATFRILYLLVVMEHASRRIIHLNVTAHPTAAWTLQQLREAIPSDHRYRFILHDRDAIFSTGFDSEVLPGRACATELR
jgi:hypothetical protein